MLALMVLCTCPNEATAQTLAAELVAAKLAACVNLVPAISSLYWWQGEVHKEAETLLLAKTTSARYPALEARLQTLHPYELPEIIAVPIEMGAKAYLQWITDSVTD